MATSSVMVYAGWIIGYAYISDSLATITNSEVQVKYINGVNNIGGAVGYGTVKLDQVNVTMDRISASGTSANTGGLIGTASPGSTVSNCEVVGDEAAGGLVITVSNNTRCVGGLVGSAAGAITDCKASNVAIKTTAGKNITNSGRLIGQSNAVASIHCLIGEEITLEPGDKASVAGGLVGYVNGTTEISQCQVSGSLTSTAGTDIAGLVGSMSSFLADGSVISDCYSTIALSGTKAHALRGTYSKGKVQKCFYY